MNMLAIEEEHRGQGWGTRMIAFWEAHLRQQGHEWAMTSTQANERAQHLYRRLGYEDVGGMRWPQDVALELLLLKRLEPEDPGEA
jgi:GNAT superfamily N-acetyltransferase